VRRLMIIVILLSTAAALGMPAAANAGGSGSGLRDRVDDLQQEIESLTEDIEDLGEPVGEFDWFDQCAYTLGVTEFGTWNGDVGYLFTGRAGQQRRRPALTMDMRGFGMSQFNFLSFPGEEPPSIECNEDAGQEFIDD
jgi:hypothetical protein